MKRFEEGIPGASATTDDSAKTIAECVQFFITAMVRENALALVLNRLISSFAGQDSLKLNMTAVDQVYPLLNELYESLCKISALPADWKGKVAVKKWYEKTGEGRGGRAGAGGAGGAGGDDGRRERRRTENADPPTSSRCFALRVSRRLAELSNMQASDQLKDDQVRQVLYELDSAYTAFHKVLAER